MASKHFLLLIGGGVEESVAEHETVELGFGEFEGAGLFHRVLGGDDVEGGWVGMGRFSDGDLAFLHGFEERALDFGRGTIDFVREEDVGEDGTELSGESAGAGEEDF